jgi:hypothetical protein
MVWSMRDQSLYRPWIRERATERSGFGALKEARSAGSQASHNNRLLGLTIADLLA